MQYNYLIEIKIFILYTFTVFFYGKIENGFIIIIIHSLHFIKKQILFYGLVRSYGLEEDLQSSLIRMYIRK